MPWNMEIDEKKKRKTIDEYLGIKQSNATWILVISIISALFTGGVLGLLSPICGLYGGYFIYKQRSDISISQTKKSINLALFILWFILYGMAVSIAGS